MHISLEHGVNVRIQRVVSEIFSTVPDTAHGVIISEALNRIRSNITLKTLKGNY